jgi:hypothetical protein
VSGSGASSVSIANRALSDAGTRSSIASLTEGSNESNAVSLIYAPVRQQLLRAAFWGTAGATATLALLKSAPGTLETPSAPASGVWSTAYPARPWLYSYAYPPDCLRGRKLIGNYAPQNGGAPIFPVPMSGQQAGFDAPGQKFEIGTDFDADGNQITVILTNVDQALLKYTRDITIESLWDASFQEADVAALAAKLCWALVGDKGRATELLKVANDKILMARADSANEGLTVMDHTPDWITVAHGARWFGTDEWGGGWQFPFGPLFTIF